MYAARSAGILQGGGVKRFKDRRHSWDLKHFPDARLSDSRLKEVIPDFDPALEFEYTQRELLLLAEKILLEDPKPMGEHPAWLNIEAYLRRLKREIYCANGTPDPSIVSGMYWRTHPEGRRWRSDTVRRKGGHSYYV